MRAALAGLHHGHYVAKLVYEESTHRFRGRVINIEGERTYFCGSSVEELRAEFAQSVQIYERICRAFGQEPERPRPVGG